MKYLKKLIYIGNSILYFFIPLILISANAGTENTPPEKYVQAQYIMGTIFRIELYSKNEQIAKKAFSNAFKELRKADLLMSNYNPESEISKALEMASDRPVQISQELFDITETALHFSEITGGMFDITIAPLVELWGFKNKVFKKPSYRQIKKIIGIVGYKNVILDRETKTLYLKKAGIKLDFGGIGKGYAIDKAVAEIKKAGIKSGVIDAVSNQYYIGSPPDREYWKVGIKNPRNQSEIIKYLKLKDTSVSTSGDYEQYFIEKKFRYSHIINPLTGLPVKGAIASTVVFKNAAYADALSTSLLLLDEKQSGTLIKRFKNIYALKISGYSPRGAGSGYGIKFKFFEYSN